MTRISIIDPQQRTLELARLEESELSTPHALEREIAELIVHVLNLETAADQVLPEAPLFGEASDLGLDSIDALELALEIGSRYGFEFEADDERNIEIFASVRSLCRHVEENRTK